MSITYSILKLYIYLIQGVPGVPGNPGQPGKDGEQGKLFEYLILFRI